MSNESSDISNIEFHIDKSKIQDIKNRIWNRISYHYFPSEILQNPIGKTNSIYFYVSHIYDSVFKLLIDDIVASEPLETFRNTIREKFMVSDWKKCCELINYLASLTDISYPVNFLKTSIINVDKFIQDCNEAFEEEHILFRIEGKRIIALNNSTE